MGFFKRLLGLGSKPTTGPEWAVCLFGLGSMPATVPTAADWAAVEMSKLPPPPRGFTWHPFKEAPITVLRPEGWHVHQVMDNTVFTGCVSKESIQTEGRFITGLTVNVFRGTKDGLRQAVPNSHPDTAVAGMLGGILPSLPSDPRFQVIYLDPCVQRTRASRLIRVRYRQLAPAMPNIPWHGPLAVQRFIIEFDQSPDVYLLTFESLESTWDESWKIGKQILTNPVFSQSPSKGLMFSIDPPLGPDDLLRAKALEAGRSLGWSLAHEDRAGGLLIWRLELEVPRKRQPALRHAGTFAWCTKRAGNEIKLYDPIDSAPLSERPTVDFLEAISIAARGLQEEFKRRWLALVGPVTFQPATPEMVELCVKAAAKVAQAQGALAKK
jgi:hypothetical protein